MLFVTLSPKQAAHYNYMCSKLGNMVNKMSSARKTLEKIANTSFDKPLAKSVYMLTSESLQCENEIRSQMDSLNCSIHTDEQFETEKSWMPDNVNSLDAICNFFEEVYFSSYKKILTDEKFSGALKNLMQKHVQLFTSSLTQLRLFHDVKTAVN